MSWRRFLHRAKSDRERQEEFESYVQIETDVKIARGMPPDEARHAARKKFGNRTLVREEIYRMNTVGVLDTLSRNVRYALRALRHNPMFTLIAILTLAIGIGANTAVFSVVNSVLLKPLAYPNADELVGIWHSAPGAPGLASVSGDLRLSPSMYFTYAEQNRTFQAIGVWTPTTASITGLAEPEQVRAVVVSDEVLQALAVPPVLGRWLTEDDQTPGGTAHVILGYGYWQRRFGGDKSVIGRSLTVQSMLTQVVGVMPQGFRIADTDPELIVPARFQRNRVTLAGFGQIGIARMKPGVTVAQANADIARMLPIWESSWPSLPGGAANEAKFYSETWRIAPAVRPLKQDVIGNIGSALWVVMGTIGIVMLIACANVANLLLVRAEARQHELAIRAALGAGWARIVRELLLESLLLGLMGGALGLVVAYGGLRVLVSMGPASLPRLNEISVDPHALGFTLLVSLFSGLLFGLIPAWKYAGPRISLVIRAGGRTFSPSRDRNRARNILVVAQVALALVLLVSSGLMIRTLQTLRTVQPGFTHPEEIQTLRISIPASMIPEPQRTARVEEDILNKLEAIPGTDSAAFATAVPMEGLDTNWDGIYAEDKTYASLETPLRMFKFISPGFFQTTGTRLIAGRDYNWVDLYDRRPVAMVSENLAREMWGTPSAAIGKRIHVLPQTPWREVVSVVEDVHNNGLQDPSPAIVYWPAMLDNLFPTVPSYIARTFTIVVRNPRAGTASFLNEVRDAVWSVNKALPLANVRTMQEVYGKSLARTSFTLVMLAIAGCMALVLGIIGIYGVLVLRRIAAPARDRNPPRPRRTTG
jgi:predicted permease